MLKTRYIMVALLSSLLDGGAALAAQSALLSTYEVQAVGQGQRISVDAVVEAVRDTMVAAQVQGIVVTLNVKVGDTVRAGQELVRVDARAAAQNVAASSAQVIAAQVGMRVAAKEFERQKQLHEKQYISQAALDRAQAQLQAAQAQVQTLEAQAGVALTQSGFYSVKAPYAGIVSEVPVVLGDMAMPGRPLVRVYDPSALRATAVVAQTSVAAMMDAKEIEIDLPGLKSAHIALAVSKVQLFPSVDAATHTSQLRMDLPSNLQGATPGMFARVKWLAASGAQTAQQLQVPASAVVRRAEMAGLYVLDAQGRPLLRQVRLGRIDGDKVEILSGVRLGEKVATNPQAAAKVR